ncbi:MAG: HlyD family efflux transporter periplasmic adaptor subunit [Polyangiaceae bacterium]|nr:HlyD family efflux transporter periplasmic adaptor subunit [Polyangiaceae bacterium]
MSSLLRVVRRLIGPMALLGAVAFAIWFRLGRPVAARPLRVDRGTVVLEAFGRGTIESQREAAVGFDLIGRLSEVLVDEGDRVSLGQELARLETSQAEADLRLAKTGISAARASLERLAADEKRARALVSAAERDSQRTSALSATGVVSAQQKDDASDRLRVARADLDRVLAQRAEATRGIDVAASGAKQKQVAMVRATLLAPFEGLVTRRLREPGDTVTVGSTVLRIVDPTQTYARAAMDESVLHDLSTDQRGWLWFPGAAEPVPGKVTRIAWEADRQTHEVFAELTPDKLERRVAIGQRVDARVELARKENALRVPIAAILRDGSGAYVLVDRSGRVTLERPRFGISGREHVEVIEGLAEGDTLLSPPSPGAKLSPGRRWRAQ